MLLKHLNLDWALTATLPPLDFVLPGLLPGTFGLMVAPGATGKSQFALDIAISLSLGRPIAGGLFAAAPASKVIVLAGEENDRLLADRLRAHLDLDERSDPNIQTNLVLLPMSGESCLLLDKGQPTALYQELKDVARGARLVIIDPLRRMHAGDENSSSEMTNFVIALEQLAKTTGAAVLGLHHANRSSATDAASQHAARGSSALVDAARWQVNLSKLDEKTANLLGVNQAERSAFLVLDFAKTNYLPPQERRLLMRQANGRLSLATRTKLNSNPMRSLGGARTL